MKAGDRQRRDGFEIVLKPTEIGGEQDLQIRHGLRQSLVGHSQRMALPLGKVQHGDRLVDLHPVRTGRMQAAQQLFINGQQPCQQIKRLEGCLARLGELQERDRTKNDRTRMDAERLCLKEVVNRLLRGEHEVLIL
ncbi:hypothetical protein D3C72_1334610 [compost metagenome]